MTTRPKRLIIMSAPTLRNDFFRRIYEMCEQQKSAAPSATKPIKLNVSTANEGTDAPYWLILDPSQMMSPTVDNLAPMITGPFFSREEADCHLNARRYAFSDRAGVWCFSGYWSRQYKEAYKGQAWPSFVPDAVPGNTGYPGTLSVLKAITEALKKMASSECESCGDCQPTDEACEGMRPVWDAIAKAEVAQIWEKQRATTSRPAVVFLVGQYREEEPWEVQGIFSTHMQAVSAAKSNPAFFIMPLNVNEVLPVETLPTGNENGTAYYPATETPSKVFAEKWLFPSHGQLIEEARQAPAYRTEGEVMESAKLRHAVRYLAETLGDSSFNAYNACPDEHTMKCKHFGNCSKNMADCWESEALKAAGLDEANKSEGLPPVVMVKGWYAQRHDCGGEGCNLCYTPNCPFAVAALEGCGE